MEKTHYGDDYLFNMQDWNPKLAKEGFEAIREKALNPIANYCSGKHGKKDSLTTFDWGNVDCKNCIKKHEREKNDEYFKFKYGRKG